MLLSGLFGGLSNLRAGEVWNWQIRQSPVTNVALKAVGYGNGQFVAVGELGTILTS